MIQALTAGATNFLGYAQKIIARLERRPLLGDANRTSRTSESVWEPPLRQESFHGLRLAAKAGPRSQVLKAGSSYRMVDAARVLLAQADAGLML